MSNVIFLNDWKDAALVASGQKEEGRRFSEKAQKGWNALMLRLNKAFQQKQIPVLREEPLPDLFVRWQVHGDPAAAFVLAERFLFGIGGARKDPERSFEHILGALEEGLPDAPYFLRTHFIDGSFAKEPFVPTALKEAFQESYPHITDQAVFFWSLKRRPGMPHI